MPNAIPSNGVESVIRADLCSTAVALVGTGKLFVRDEARQSTSIGLMIVEMRKANSVLIRKELSRV